MKWKEQSFGSVLTDTLSLTLDNDNVRTTIEPNTGRLMAVEIIEDVLELKNCKRCKVLSINSDMPNGLYQVGSVMIVSSSKLF